MSLGLLKASVVSMGWFSSKTISLFGGETRSFVEDQYAQDLAWDQGVLWHAHVDCIY